MESKKNLAEWLSVETQYSATGTLHDLGGEGDAYRYLIHDWQNKKAETVCALGEIPDIHRLRAKIARSDFAEAGLLIEKLNSQPQGSAALGELLFERARVAAYENRWFECVAICNDLITMRPASVTLVSAYQIRAVALFEMGGFAQAKKDIEIVSGSKSLFPFLPAQLYAECVRIRIAARETGTDLAFQLLKELWDSQKEQDQINFNSLLTLLRAEIDLNRLSHKPFGVLAMSCARIADLMGDELFHTLALLDMATSEIPRQEREVLFRQVASKKTMFVRVRNLLNEIHDPSESASTTGKVIAASLVNPGLSAKQTLPLVSNSAVKMLAFLERDILVGLDPFRMVSSKLPAKIREALLALSSGTVSRTDFFQQVWDLGRYAGHLHDNSIGVLIHRMRKEFGLQVKSEDKSLNLINCLVLK